MTKKMYAILFTLLLTTASSFAHHGGNHGHFCKIESLRAAGSYVQALQRFKSIAEANQFYAIGNKVDQLVDTVQFSIVRPLQDGFGQKYVQNNLRLVHRDVKQVWNQITLDKAGSYIIESFRSTNKVEKVHLMRVLNR